VKIKTLLIEGFRSHKETRLELERITVLRGANSVGKSSVEEALGFLFAARTMTTGANGQGMDRLIQKGADKAVVTLELADGAKMRASLTAKGGRQFQAKNGAAPELSRDVWSCLCSTRYFARMKPEDQRDLLAGLVVPKDIPFPEELIEMLGEAYRGKSGDVLKEIGDGYQVAFEQRTELSRRIRDWREPAKASDSDIDPDAVKAQIKTRQEELDARRADRARMLGGSAGDKDRADLEADAKKEQGELTAATRDRAIYAGDVLSKEDLAKQKAVLGKRDEWKTLSRKLGEQTSIAATAAETLDGANFEALDMCPTCGQAVTAEVRQAMYSPMIEANNRAIQERDATQAALNALDCIEADFGEAESKIEKHAQAKVGVQRSDASIDRAKARLATIREKLAGMPAAVDALDTSAIDTAISDLETRIERGWTMHREASMAAQRKIDSEKAWTERKEMDVEKAKLDRACEVLGPKGARVQILDKYLSQFVGRMNALLQAWDYGIDVTMEPYSFKLERKDMRWQIELDLASESEKLRFGIAFQIALAVHLGVGFAVIDEVDTLTPDGRSILFNQLWSDERIEQAILLLTDEKVEAPRAPGTVFYRLDMVNGHTVATEQARTGAQ
jgi:DNA repair exonuclease SbcCD ATPase subunit